MSFNHIECEQGSDEWFQARLGKITASMAASIVTKTGKRSASADEIVNRAVAELITGEQDETFQSPAMVRGKELENDALNAVNFVYGYDFKQCGFLDTGLGFGCSPDGLDLENNVSLELKVPMTHTHIGYMAGKGLPKQYYQQVQEQLLVTGFDKVIFASYHPELPLFHVEVTPDKDFQDKMRSIITDCASEIEEKYQIVKAQIES